MGTYRVPSSSTRVTSSWQDHKDRNPPSTQPGTDYGVNLGSPLYAVGDGNVIAVKTTNAGDGEGRTITVRLDEGRDTRSLHLQEVHVSVGQRVTRGQKIGLTGASGYGSDFYYGPHVHQTLWPHEAWADPTIDFEKYVGEPPPPVEEPVEEDEDMAMRGASYPLEDGVLEYMLFNEVSGWWVVWTTGNSNYNPPLMKEWETNNWPRLTLAHARRIQDALDKVRAHV